MTVACHHQHRRADGVLAPLNPKPMYSSSLNPEVVIQAKLWLKSIGLTIKEIYSEDVMTKHNM